MADLNKDTTPCVCPCHQENYRCLQCCNYNINKLIISKEEAKKLYQYFLDCGYISYEFHKQIHEFIDRLDKFVKDNEEKNISSTPKE